MVLSQYRRLNFFLTLKRAFLLLHSEKFLDVAPGPKDTEMRNIWRGLPLEECIVWRWRREVCHIFKHIHIKYDVCEKVGVWKSERLNSINLGATK